MQYDESDSHFDTIAAVHLSTVQLLRDFKIIHSDVIWCVRARVTFSVNCKLHIWLLQQGWLQHQTHAWLLNVVHKCCLAIKRVAWFAVKQPKTTICCCTHLTYGKEGTTGFIRIVSSLSDCCCIDNMSDTSTARSSIFVVRAHLLLYCYTIRTQSCLLLSFVDCYDYVHVLAIVSADRWQTKTPYFTLSLRYVLVEICFYYKELRDDQYQNETEIYKFDWLFDRAFSCLNFYLRHVALQIEMKWNDERQWGEKKEEKTPSTFCCSLRFRTKTTTWN